ncbi:MAG: 23S rRNA (guanosine(2251)-2'-O)-methyltransferase RlmB [Ruminococcus sp.]|nr:23S rRNA (guanosine(2251)-2'-O)-methyltransferase RlmB [Ruminococcus sp.]
MKKNLRDKPTERSDSEIIVGRNPVIEAIKSGRTIDSVYINANAKGSISVIVNLCKENSILVKRVDDRKLDKMSNGASHQGVAAVLGCASYCSVSDILENAKSKGESPFIIICDEIEDPHNLGAIIRTAEAAGAHGIIIPKRRSASLSSTVYKTSAGAASHVLVARVTNLASAIDELKQNGVWIYGTDAKGENYTSVSLEGAVALVIGSEGFGMGRLIKEKCDFLLKLPMYGKVNSLNASVAAGVFMYEVVRQRGN